MTFTQWLKAQPGDDAVARDFLAYAEGRGGAWPADAQDRAAYDRAIEQEADEERRAALRRDLGVLWRRYEGALRSRRRGAWDFFALNWMNLSLFGVIFALLGALFFGLFSETFLSSLKDVEAARGLITFLFAVGTIGVFLIVVVTIFIDGDASPDDRFARGKDVLALLIGIFGTILGFYFGSPEDEAGSGDLALRSLSVSPAQPTAGQPVEIWSSVDGGRGPYNYIVKLLPADGMSLPNGDVISASDNGVIRHRFDAPDVTEASEIGYRIVVIDSDGNAGRPLEGTIEINPATAASATSNVAATEAGESGAAQQQQTGGARSPQP